MVHRTDHKRIHTRENSHLSVAIPRAKSPPVAARKASTLDHRGSAPRTGGPILTAAASQTAKILEVGSWRCVRETEIGVKHRRKSHGRIHLYRHARYRDIQWTVHVYNATHNRVRGDPKTRLTLGRNEHKMRKTSSFSSSLPMPHATTVYRMPTGWANQGTHVVPDYQIFPTTTIHLNQKYCRNQPINVKCKVTCWPIEVGSSNLRLAA